jgi:type IX secretion system PorP/SprF family membrane protein
MFKKLFILVCITSLAFVNDAKAQDPAFSQFFANPLYLNPAMAGSDICPRISLNHRNQWPGIGKTYVTYSASYDQYVDKLGGGIGFGIAKDVSGAGDLNTTHINASYSYRLRVNKKLTINAGFEGAYRQLGVDWSGLTFGDQIDPTQGFIYPTNEDIINYDNIKGFADFAAGFMAFGQANNNVGYYFGFASHHITRPDQGFITESRLPMKITANIGASIPLNQFGTYRTTSKSRSKKAAILSPNVLFQKQQDFMQINYGIYVIKGPIVGGMWLRQSAQNVDSFIILLGLEQDSWKVGYSYDVTISDLNNSNTQGAHEFSFAYRLPCRSKGKSFETINCPNF